MIRNEYAELTQLFAPCRDKVLKHILARTVDGWNAGKFTMEKDNSTVIMTGTGMIREISGDVQNFAISVEIRVQLGDIQCIPTHIKVVTACISPSENHKSRIPDGVIEYRVTRFNSRLDFDIERVTIDMDDVRRRECMIAEPLLTIVKS